MDKLEQIAEFLSCKSEMLNKIHMDVFGSKYMKAISEAMMPAGVITEEYKDGLIRLQNRLSLDDSSRLNTPGTIKNNWRWKLNRPLKEIENNIRKFSDLGSNFGRTRN